MTTSPAIGRPRKVVQQTFAINEGDLRVVSHLTGFRRVATIMCVHIPAVREGDILLMREPAEHMIGEAEVLQFKHFSTKRGMKTVLAIRLRDREGECREEE